MIQFIFWSLIGAYIAYRFREKETSVKNKKARIAMNSLVVALGIGLGGGIGAFCGLAFGRHLPHSLSQFEGNKVDIVTLGNASELSGSFFLATGQIGTEQVYRFYYKTSDGGKKFDQLSARQVTIYEEDRKDAYMTRVGQAKEYSENIYLWLIPKFMIERRLSSYAIHVPKGTIKVEFKLDLK